MTEVTTFGRIHIYIKFLQIKSLDDVYHILKDGKSLHITM